MEVASKKGGFLLALTKIWSQWLKFWLVAQMCASKTSFAFLNWWFLIMEKGLRQGDDDKYLSKLLLTVFIVFLEW